jgi:hypothetical protein
MMKSINLMPKVPWLKRWFSTLLLAGTGLFLIIGLSLGLVSMRLGGASQTLESEIASVQSKVTFLKKQREIDPITQSYNELNKEVLTIRDNRKDWPSVMEMVTQGMPSSSKLSRAAVTEGRVLELESSFDELGQVADYIVYLKGTGLFEPISVKSVELVDAVEALKSSTAAPQSLQVTPSTVVKPTANKTPEEKLVTAEELIASFQKETPPATDEADSILNELKWLVTGQAYQEHFGIGLPKPTGTTDSGPPPGSPFTEKEWQEARRKVEELKKTRLVDSSGNTTGSASENGELSIPKVYRAVIVATLKAPTNEK